MKHISRDFIPKKKSISSGFTVLELLIVIGIISILIALVFTSLNAARRHSRDDRLVSNVKTISLGLFEYFSICREYPKNLVGSETCPQLQGQSKTLADVIPHIDEYHVNTPTPQGAGSYGYAAFIDTGSSVAGLQTCNHFHVWVELGEENASLIEQKANVTSPVAGTTSCGGSGGLGMQTSKIFDIYK